MESVQELLSSLREMYVKGLYEKKLEIEIVVAPLMVGEYHNFTHQQVKDLIFLAHKLAGSSGTYGFFEIGKVAQLIIADCRESKNVESEKLTQHYTILAEHVAELLQLVQDAITGGVKVKNNFKQSAETLTKLSLSG